MTATTDSLLGAAQKLQSNAMSKVGDAATTSHKIDETISAPIRKFGGFFGTFFAFVSKWFLSRNYWHLIPGIPAIVLVMPLAYCLIRIPIQNRAAKANHYFKSAYESLEQKDYKTADLLFQKAGQIQGRKSDRVIFQTALALSREGKDQEAVETIQSIASLDQPGLPEAHLWLASKLLSPSLTNIRPISERLIEAQAHLEYASERTDALPEIELFLAEVFLRRGFKGKANAIADKLSRRPGNRGKIQLAALYLMLNQRQKSLAIVSQIDASCQQKLNNKQNLTNEEIKAWISAAEIELDFEKMERVLQIGQDLFPDDESLAMTSARLSQLKLIRINQKGKTQSNETVELVSHILKQDPENRYAIMNLGFLALLGDDDSSLKAMQTLKDQSETSVRALETMATIAVSKNDLGTAKEYFQDILKRNPEHSNALNNLAWIVAHSPPTDATEALQLVNRAIALNSKEPNYRDTKGHILLKLERWQEAIDELTIALNGLPDNIPSHFAIAIAYEKTGKPELAKVHREIANARSP